MRGAEKGSCVGRKTLGFKKLGEARRAPGDVFAAELMYEASHRSWAEAAEGLSARLQAGNELLSCGLWWWDNSGKFTMASTS